MLKKLEAAPTRHRRSSAGHNRPTRGVASRPVLGEAALRARSDVRAAGGRGVAGLWRRARRARWQDDSASACAAFIREA